MIQPSNPTLAPICVGPLGAATPPNPALQTGCGGKRGDQSAKTDREDRSARTDRRHLIGSSAHHMPNR